MTPKMSHSPMTLIDEIQERRLPPVAVRRAIRLAARVSQARMARELGVHRITIVRWENGASEPRGEHRKIYARLLADLQQVGG
jgi:DNA-binding transcriptional regulator YiaG